MEKILSNLAGKIKESPTGQDSVSINYGIHFTGGEPFLNFNLLLKVTRIAEELEIPSTFVETNCFWCVEDDIVRRMLNQLRQAGLKGILISVNPFILEHVPFKRIERAVRISKKVFGRNVMLYQKFFFNQFREFNIMGNLPFDAYLEKCGFSGLHRTELLPMGRVPYMLAHLYRKHPANRFFNISCKDELTRPWHIHIDNYGNYMAGYCGGISLGNAENLNSIRQVNLDDKPILGALVNDLKELLEFGKHFGYKERGDGYISKCHLCVDIRRYIIQHTDEFKELNPKEFYHHLEL